MTIREVQQASNPEQQALYTVFDKNDRCLACRRGMSGSEVSERPSTWLPPIRGKLAEGAPAYHLYRLQDLPNRLGPAIYDTAWRGERVDIPGGALVPEARLMHRLPTWDQSTAWLFACDCAEHVLPLFEEERRHDERPRQAIQTARRFLAGRATRDDLNLALNTVHSTISETRADMPWDAGLLAANAAANAASGDYRAAIWTAARAAARSPRWTPLWVRAWRARGREFGAALAKVWDIASRDEQDWQARRLAAYLAGALPEHPPYTPLSDLPARDFCHCGHTSAGLD